MKSVRFLFAVILTIGWCSIAEANMGYDIYRDYSTHTGRYIQSDPVGLQGGVNTYTYVGGNPLSYADPLGLQTLVITSGWNGGVNIFGHSALAFTRQGVYSYGTKDPYGANATNYLIDQLLTRNVTVTILNTTPEQEKMMVRYYKENYGRGSHYFAQSNNCANAATGALSAAGVLPPLFATDLTIPYDVQRWTSRMPGAVTQTISKGDSLPNIFQSFNP